MYEEEAERGRYEKSGEDVGGGSRGRGKKTRRKEDAIGVHTRDVLFNLGGRGTHVIS